MKSSCCCFHSLQEVTRIMEKGSCNCGYQLGFLGASQCSGRLLKPSLYLGRCKFNSQTNLLSKLKLKKIGKPEGKPVLWSLGAKVLLWGATSGWKVSGWRWGVLTVCQAPAGCFSLSYVVLSFSFLLIWRDSSTYSVNNRPFSGPHS